MYHYVSVAMMPALDHMGYYYSSYNSGIPSTPAKHGHPRSFSETALVICFHVRSDVIFVYGLLFGQIYPIRL